MADTLGLEITIWVFFAISIAICEKANGRNRMAQNNFRSYFYYFSNIWFDWPIY